MIVGPHWIGTLASAQNGSEASSYSELVLASGAVGYWKLDETSGTTAADETANGLNGSYNGSPDLTEQELISDSGSAVFLDGSSDVSISHDPLFSVGSGSFSLETWIKTSDGASDRPSIIGKAGDAIPFAGYQLWLNTDGTCQLWTRDQTQTKSEIASSTVINDGVVHHVVGVRDSSGSGRDLFLYVDGILENSITGAAADDLDQTEPFRLGMNRAGDPRRIVGTLDEASFYAHALTEQEIQEHYDAGVGN